MIDHTKRSQAAYVKRLENWVATQNVSQMESGTVTDWARRRVHNSARPGHHVALRDHMTADELRAFIAAVRGEADAALARLATVDADALPADLHERWEQSRHGWEEMRRLTADDVVALHEAACFRAGRELTPG